jgi:hypothetical protein
VLGFATGFVAFPGAYRRRLQRCAVGFKDRILGQVFLVDHSYLALARLAYRDARRALVRLLIRPTEDFRPAIFLIDTANGSAFRLAEGFGGL